MKMHMFEILIGFLLMITVSYATMIFDGRTTSETHANKSDSSYSIIIPDNGASKTEKQSETTAGSVCMTTPFSNNDVTFNDEQIEMIRKELFIPDYKMKTTEFVQGEAYLWEGTGLWMVPVGFYIDDICIAHADVNVDHCTLMRSVIAYEYDPENEKLEKDAYSQINDLMERYYTALSDGDIDTLQIISHGLSDGDVVRIKAKSSLIDLYDDIHCYTIMGPKPDTYIVYVTFYTKYNDIDSMVPGLNTYYVCTENSNNSMYIFINNYNTAELTENERDYVYALNGRDDVEALIHDVDERYNEVVRNDSDAKDFMNSLPEMIDQLSGVARQERDNAYM